VVSPPRPLRFKSVEERSVAVSVPHWPNKATQPRLSHPEVSTRLRKPSSSVEPLDIFPFFPHSPFEKAKSLTVVFQTISSAQAFPTTRFIIQDLDLSHPSARTLLCEKQTLLFQPRIGLVSVFHPSSTIEEVCCLDFSRFFLDFNSVGSTRHHLSVATI
jgi:hypothetical protein